MRFDMHVHTSETSPCGNVTAAETVRLYREAGYSGICITDHYTRSFFEGVDGTWEQKVEAFLQGYRRAAAAAPAGFGVFLGLELRLDGSNNEYLVYGVSEAFLNKHPALYAWDLPAIRNLTQQEGLLLYQAHPFRDGMTRPDPALLDGMEVYNGNPRHNSRNEEAFRYATGHRLRMISGSDCHELCDVGRGGIVLPRDPGNEAGLLEWISHGDYELLRS